MTDIAALIDRLRMGGPNALEVTDEAAEALSRLTAPPPKVAKELCNWILWFLSEECSLDPSCVSSADRSNVENAIINALMQIRL